MTRYEAIEAALIELAATHAWQCFGQIRAFDHVRKGGPLLTSAEADAKARAALALPEDDGWLPIETAPKDGTVFQGWLTNSFGTGFLEPRCRFNGDELLEIFGRVDYDEDGWDHDFDGLELKRWHPLPNPPKDSQ